MTTLFHSGHKSLHATHLLDARRPGSAELYALTDADPQILGQYRILECLGSGGMGKVFLAEHQMMGRKVAIKIMSPRLLSDADSCARFRQEVRLVSQLCHPHIVLAHDADASQGIHYFVMEYVEGADLGQIVAQYGALPIPFACECIRQAALGLQHAHEHGLVHCDIKPSNLLLRGGMSTVYAYLGHTTDASNATAPVVKILDFGLARLAGRQVPLALFAGSPEPELCGTPDYMAPELGRDSSTVDIRCDLYSLGCTFSFLLTGQVPYPGGSWSEKLIRHHYDPAIPVCHTRPGIPEEVEAIVSRLMAKDPGDRFATPGEVTASIESWQQANRAKPMRSGSIAKEAPPAPQGMHYIEHSPPPEAPGTPEPPQTPVEDVPSAFISRKRRQPFFWPLAACLAIAGGFGSAWLVTTPYMGENIASIQGWVRRNSGLPGFRIGNSNSIHASLDLAVADAQDGDTIYVQGNGPFRSRGISCRDKALTIKADDGFHPQFELITETGQTSWTPLFWTNRKLTLEGFRLSNEPEKNHARESTIAHLVYTEGPGLHLIDCELTAKSGQALIVARRTAEVAIENCTAESNGPALCVEVRDFGPTQVSISKSRLRATDRGATTSVFWSSSTPKDLCQIQLSENEFSGSRLLAFDGLTGSVAIEARQNRFEFRQALMSTNSAALKEAEKRIRWVGSNNQFASSANWILNGVAGASIHNLQDWKNWWQSAETGSSEATITPSTAP